jgi:hypothetical protein
MLCVAPVRCCEKSAGDEYLLLSCDDNTLVLFERDRKLLVNATSDIVSFTLALNFKRLSDFVLSTCNRNSLCVVYFQVSTVVCFSFFRL